MVLTTAKHGTLQGYMHVYCNIMETQSFHIMKKLIIYAGVAVLNYETLIVNEGMCDTF